jgi:hypothetical protein
LIFQLQAEGCNYFCFAADYVVNQLRMPERALPLAGNNNSLQPFSLRQIHRL